MALADKIRTQHIENIMQTLAAKPHRKRIVNLNDIGSIGLIVQRLNATPDIANESDKDRITISQFNTMLKKRGIQLRIIEHPASQEMTDKFGLPRPDYLLSFTKYHYDMLIDATTDDGLFGPYVTLSTSSSLRVGYINNVTGDKPYSQIYDLLIIGKEPLDLATYLPNILHYITQIRK